MKKVFLILFLFLNLYSFGQVNDTTIPISKGYVSDYESIFTAEENSKLTSVLLDYEKETTIEIAILTIFDFDGEPADFAQKTAEKWGIGKKDINNGLLILMSKNKGVIRFQTGYGLEGYIPDGWLKHIGDSVTFVAKTNYDISIMLIEKIKQRIGKEGYSLDHNKELIVKNKAENKENKKDESAVEWILKNVSWYWIIVIVALWVILFIISPDTAIWILFFALSKDNDSSDSKGFGGGLFGGGGSSSSWK